MPRTRPEISIETHHIQELTKKQLLYATEKMRFENYHGWFVNMRDVTYVDLQQATVDPPIWRESAFMTTETLRGSRNSLRVGSVVVATALRLPFSTERSDVEAFYEDPDEASLKRGFLSIMEPRVLFGSKPRFEAYVTSETQGTELAMTALGQYMNTPELLITGEEAIALSNQESRLVAAYHRYDEEHAEELENEIDKLFNEHGEIR